MSIPTFPRLTSLQESYPDQFLKLNAAIKNRDHQRIIQYASTIVNLNSPKQILFALLEVRSYAFLMIGHFRSALADAERLMELFPLLTTGYIRKGHLLSMYGYQLRALEAYNEGFAVIQQRLPQSSDPLTVAEIGELEQRSDIATELSGIKLDPVAVLPDDITTDIFALFPQVERVSCLLKVSQGWRTRILNCAALWRDLVLENESKDFPLLHVADFLYDYIKKITITTSTPEIIRVFYMKKLKEGYFNSIQSFTLKVPKKIQNIQDYTTETSMALLRIQNTLTRLDIDVQNSKKLITIETLLSTCKNLTDLSYSVKSTFSSHVGDMTGLAEHPYLINLELRSRSFVCGQDLEPILRQCPRLRRLVLDGCNCTAVDTVFQSTITADLEIAGFNELRTKLPQLQGKKKEKRGLRVLHIALYKVSPGLSGVVKILQLIYKHKTTLKTLKAEIPFITHEGFEQLCAIYPDFDLVNLETLMLYVGGKKTEEFMLRLISNSTDLKTLEWDSIHDMQQLTSHLIHMPPLSRLSIEWWPSNDPSEDSNNIVEDKDLIQLFKNYAQLPITTASLQSISFSDCKDVSDNVLLALVHVKNLQEITLKNLPNITTNGIKEFFNRTRTQQLNDVQLLYLPMVTDDILSTLSDHVNLSSIRLRGLENITDRGLICLIDIAPLHLRNLEVKSCSRITSDYWMFYARRKLKKYVILSR